MLRAEKYLRIDKKFGRQTLKWFLLVRKVQFVNNLRIR